MDPEWYPKGSGIWRRHNGEDQEMQFELSPAAPEAARAVEGSPRRRSARLRHVIESS